MSAQLQVTGEAKIRDIQGPVVANSGVITALDGAASQYVRGDGTLADFPTSTGGGSSVSYYLNSSVSQGTIGGVAYRELSKDPIIGAGTDIPISSNGYVANYITDANDPDVILVPGGNFNCEFYFSVSNDTGNPTTYAELYKYDGTTFTLLGTSAGVPESINQGTTIAPYYFAIPVATAALSVTDRLAIRIYVNVDGRTVTLHTENGHLCQVVTTLSKGMVSLNNLTDQSQYLATGTSGTNFAIVSSGDTHTFNLPVASATNTGKLSSTDWSTFNGKVPYTGATGDVNLGVYNISAQNAFLNGVSGVNGGNLFLRQDIDFGQSAGYTTLYSTGKNLGFVSYVGSFTYNALFNLNSLTNNSTRTFTLPDLSGTLALLEGTQTFSGSKTFDYAISANYGIALLNGAIPPITSIYYAALSGNSTGLSITYRTGGGTNYTNNLNFPANNNSYLFPSASGTLALTTDISYPVTSVFGRTGAVVATSGDYTTTQVTEGTNLYYTDARARGALSFTAGSGAYNSTTGVITIPTDNNQIANGSGYITSSALSGYLPLTGGTLTGGLSGTTATFSGLGTFYHLTITGATAGRIFYAQTGGIISQSGNLNWDNTNEMLGVGTPNPTAVITAFSNNAATQFKASGNAPAFTFSESLTTSTRAAVFGLATANNQFITGTAAGDMAIANQSTTAGAIIFGTGTSERMRMNSVGRFLIGTSADNGALLQVNGAATLTGALSGTSATFNGQLNANYGYFGDTGAGSWVLYTTNNDQSNARIRMNNSGAGGQTFDLVSGLNGTSNAGWSIYDATNGATRFAIASTGAATFSSSVSINSAITTYSTAAIKQTSSLMYGGLAIYSNNGTESFLGIGNTGSAVGLSVTYGASGSFLPLTFSTSEAERMRITASGNVGIGTSSPQLKLDIQTGSLGAYHNTASSNGAQIYLGDMNFSGGAYSTSAPGIGSAYSSAQGVAGDLAFYIYASVASSRNEAMRILGGSGNVGIGNTGAADVRLLVKSVDNTGSNYGFIVNNSSNANLLFVRNDGLILTGSQSASPYNLSTTGRSAVIESNGVLGYLVSTRESKANIKTIENVDFINQLNPVSFNYRKKDYNTNTFTDELYDNITYGFIADEVEQVNKELVMYNQDGSLGGVEYNSIIAILTKAVQELKAEIEILKNK